MSIIVPKKFRQTKGLKTKKTKKEGVFDGGSFVLIDKKSGVPIGMDRVNNSLGRALDALGIPLGKFIGKDTAERRQIRETRAKLGVISKLTVLSALSPKVGTATTIAVGAITKTDLAGDFSSVVKVIKQDKAKTEKRKKAIPPEKPRRKPKRKKKNTSHK